MDPTSSCESLTEPFRSPEEADVGKEQEVEECSTADFDDGCRHQEPESNAQPLESENQ